MAEEKRTEKKKVAENTPACRLEPEGHALADRTRFVAASSRHFNSHRVKREWYVIKKKKHQRHLRIVYLRLITFTDRRVLFMC